MITNACTISVILVVDILISSYIKKVKYSCYDNPYLQVKKRSKWLHYNQVWIEGYMQIGIITATYKSLCSEKAHL